MGCRCCGGSHTVPKPFRPLRRHPLRRVQCSGGDLALWLDAASWFYGTDLRMTCDGRGADEYASRHAKLAIHVLSAVTADVHCGDDGPTAVWKARTGRAA